MSFRFTIKTAPAGSPTVGSDNGSTPGLVVALALCVFATAALADIEVRTIGGGRLSASGPDHGLVDGNTLQVSQFHMPVSAAVDAAGHVYIADRDNGAIRKLDVANDRSHTIIPGLNLPVAVAIANSDDLYVLTKGDGRTTKFDRFGIATEIGSGLSSPIALAIDSRTNVFVTEERGTLLRIRAKDGTRTLVATGFNQPGGIAALDSGLLAVSDTGKNLIRFIHAESGQTVLQVGTGEAGFQDGPPARAKFNHPQQIAKTPNGSIVVADRLNHRVRLIDLSGTVTTVYGVAPSAWEGPLCLDCEPMVLPGWFDGPGEFAEAREPVGIAVSRDGKLYATEVYYHLVREITGASFTGTTTGTTDTNVVVLPPIISPESGFFPLGQPVTVVNQNPSALVPSAIYYTTDGSEPTTNSFQLELAGDRGTIFWSSPTRDLTSLRLKAFIGPDASSEVSGVPSPVSEIGLPRDVVAGMGSTVVLPVVLNLRPNDPLKSLQFRVEITPDSPNTPMIPPTFAAMSITTNDFIRVATSDREESSNSTNKTSFSFSGYLLGDTRGLAITMIGTNANFSTKNFAVVAMLSIPMPASARPGHSYRIEVVRPSGTSDGIQASVPLSAMPARRITVENVSYEVGDTARAIWYNSDTPGFGFGDGILDNADVNNASALPSACACLTPFPIFLMRWTHFLKTRRTPSAAMG
jgi:sugar lactone lactonase YvrE